MSKLTEYQAQAMATRLESAAELYAERGLGNRARQARDAAAQYRAESKQRRQEAAAIDEAQRQARAAGKVFCVRCARVFVSCEEYRMNVSGKPICREACSLGSALERAFRAALQ